MLHPLTQQGAFRSRVGHKSAPVRRYGPRLSMGATSGTKSDDIDREPRTDPPTGDPSGQADGEQPTRPLVAAAGDRCTACDAPLASDQRYCLACGERRGKARFAIGAATAAAVPVTNPRSERRRPRVSSGTALIAGVGTLLLALGVGVLIGRTNNSTPAASRTTPVVVTVPAASGGSAAGTPTTASSTNSGTKKSARSKVTKVVVTKQVATKASAAAAKVLGGKVSTPPTVTVGQSGKGAGYSGGHFTGQFFGP